MRLWRKLGSEMTQPRRGEMVEGSGLVAMIRGCH